MNEKNGRRKYAEKCERESEIKVLRVFEMTLKSEIKSTHHKNKNKKFYATQQKF